MENNQKAEVVFRGIPASPGVAHSQAFIHIQPELYIPSYSIREEDCDNEADKLERALVKTRHEISEIRIKVALRLGEDEARIFDAHLMVLDDPALIEETIRELRERLQNVEHVFQTVAKKYITAFENIDDDFIKERINDLRDVSRRILHNLMGQALTNLDRIGEKRIIVGRDFTPSDAATVPIHLLQGIVTETGSRTSHYVIMARSAGIPAVVGASGVTASLQNGDELIIDGYDGLVIVNPTESTLFRYGEIRRERKHLQKRFLSVSQEPAETLDGLHVDVMANIEGGDEMPRLMEYGADGVGLFRTEFLFLKGSGYPTEEEQFEAYKHVLSVIKPKPVTIRTLDIGGDKLPISGEDYRVREDNPYLGFRAIRFCLANQEVFRTQLRALLRASVYGNLKIMWPMISGVGELKAANALLEEVKEDFRQRGVPFTEDLDIGCMIEIPSAAQTCDLLSRYSRFFSVGTNDLIQYTIAVDRGNDRVAQLYQPLHPAILRTLRHIVKQAEMTRTQLGICGEMAGDPSLAPLLLGLGFRQVSVSSTFLPAVKYILRKVSFQECLDLAGQALEMEEPEDIQILINSFYQRKLKPDLEGTD